MGFDTRKEIVQTKSVLRQKENVIVLVEKNASTISSCWHKNFVKMNHSNGKGRSTLNAGVRMGWARTSQWWWDWD